MPYGNNNLSIENNQSNFGGLDANTIKQFNIRAKKLGLSFENFLKARASCLQSLGMEPEYYYVIKNYCDTYAVSFQTFVPYIRRGIYDLNTILKQMQSQGTIMDSMDGGSAIEKVVGNPQQQQAVTTEDIPTIAVPDFLLNGNKQECPSIPMAKVENTHNTNQEKFDDIVQAIEEVKEPEVKKEVKKPTAKKEDEATKKLKEMHKKFPEVTFDEFVAIVNEANKKGIDVKEYYLIFLESRRKDKGTVGRPPYGDGVSQGTASSYGNIYNKKTAPRTYGDGISKGNAASYGNTNHVGNAQDSRLKIN